MTKKKTERRPVPYAKIQKMLASGKTYKEVAISLDRYDEKATDPTKPLRAIVCRMKKHGYKNSKGKLVKLKFGKKTTNPQRNPKQPSKKMSVEVPEQAKGEPMPSKS